MKILIDLTSLADNFSGIERYAASISEELVKKTQHEFLLIFKESVHPLFRCAAEQENVQTVVLPRCSKLLFNQFRLPWQIRKMQADWYLFLAFPVPVLLHKKNMVSTVHDICCWDCPETMNGLSAWYFRISHRFAVRKCRYILTISDFSRKRILDRLRCPERKLVRVYCGVKSEKPQENLQIVKEKYQLPEQFLLSLSTLEPRKNLGLLLQAYEKAVTAGELTIPLVLAGRKGWKIEKLLSGISLSVRDRIHITGFIEEKDLPALYAAAAGFVFPSMYEGFGLPPLEAMAYGTPVLSSDAASMPEVLGQACLYFSSGDADDLARQLVRLCHLSEEERQTSVSAGLAQAEQFNWAREADLLLTALQRVGEDS